MPSVNKTKYAILGILSFGPRSGYDIKKTVDRSLHFFWRENFGHIYPVLKRLEREGFAAKQKEDHRGGRARHAYALTPKGGKELRSWLSSRVSSQPPRNEMLLKLFFGRQMELKSVQSLLKAERAEHADLLKKFKVIEKDVVQTNSPDLPYWLSTIRFGIGRSKMIVAWCDETLKTLTAHGRR